VIAEVAQALFASIDPDVITAAGGAITAGSTLYGALNTALGSAHTTLFTGDKNWTGTAATAAKTNVGNLSTSATQVQTGLGTIATALTTYGAALQPFKGKTYPTPIPGSRDPEAAGDLAVVSLASIAAAASIAAGVAQMMPVANPSSSTSSKTSSTTPTTSNTSLASTPTTTSTTPATTTPATSTLPAGTGTSTSSTVPLASGMAASTMSGGALVDNTEGSGTAAAEDGTTAETGDAAMEDGVPMMPLTGGAARRAANNERIRNAYTRHPDFWTDGVPTGVPAILGLTGNEPHADQPEEWAAGLPPEVQAIITAAKNAMTTG
jgi:hypothetical protein